ncbi:MAG TPA: FadR/GntR family transcriptional regulator [Amycolatopsis sp.]|nr:FadR/GntR family transcriptional regulator [Amycolatopsis sp.]
MTEHDVENNGSLGAHMAGKEFKATRVVRPRKQVEEQIRQAILSGQFAQGDKLPTETDLAERFAVSRPTIREALQALADAGLVHKVPGAAGGSFVRSVNHEALGKMLHESMSNILRLGSLDIGEVTEMRRMLEIPAARLAAEHREKSHLVAMRQVIARQSAITLEDPDIPELDATFHSTVADASGNRLLAAFVGSLHLVTRPARFLELSPEVGRCTIRQHKAIFKAIESTDADAAGSAMSEHLDYVLRFSSAPEA